MKDLYFIILAVLTVIMVIIAAKSAMLRNEIFNQANFCKIAADKGITNPRSAFSLGRTQLAFWSVIILSSYLYSVFSKSLLNFKLDPDIDPVNLYLLGIAAGTTVVAKVIDNSQKDTQSASIPQQDYPSKGLLMDIISDEKGISIHRLQNVGWSLAVGGIYIAYVFSNHKMPDSNVITPNLLALMGVSTGAYLGLKTSENKAEPISNVTVNENVNAAPVVAEITPVIAAVTPVVQGLITDISNSGQHDK